MVPPSDTSRLSRSVSKDDRTDAGEDESSHSEASIQEQHQQKLQRVRKTRKARASSSSSRRPSKTELTSSTGNGENGKKMYAPEKYSDKKENTGSSTPRRPSSATAGLNRPRANTLSNQGSSKISDAKSPRSHAAAMSVQKSWRGYSAKEKDAERVNQLKEDVRNLRTEEHIKHLT